MFTILALAVVGIGLIGWAVWHYLLAPYVDLCDDLDARDVF